MKSTTAVMQTLLPMMLLAASPVAQGQSAENIVALRCGLLIDVVDGNHIESAVILIDGERITAVGQDLAIPPNARVVDLSQATVLPGLIDAHTHLLSNLDAALDFDRLAPILTLARMSTAKRALLGAAMAREYLEAGFTAVRDVGNSGLNGEFALRDAISEGWVPGPRLWASTRALAPAGGQYPRMFARQAQSLIQQEYVEVSGVEEARRAVREAYADGADLIKVIVDAPLSFDEVKVIVEEAERVGLRVAAHALNDEATRIAAAAGVHSIDHAYGVSDDVLGVMAEKGIFLVPTDGTADFLNRLPPDRREQVAGLIETVTKITRERLARAMKIGVPIAAGSDNYHAHPEKTRGEARVKMLISIT